MDSPDFTASEWLKVENALSFPVIEIAAEGSLSFRVIQLMMYNLKTPYTRAVYATRLLRKGMGYPLPEVWRVADRSQVQVMAHYLTSTAASTDRDRLSQGGRRPARYVLLGAVAREQPDRSRPEV